MMPAEKRIPLIERLPAVSGGLEAGAALAPLTWFRTGGPAEALFRPADVDDLAKFLKELEPGVPVTVIGLGSNLLVRDAGVPGVVIKLGKAFGEIRTGGGLVRAGAGATDVSVAHAAAKAGLTGLEFLRGIPGTIGGALRMNAGAYGSEVADVLVSARALDRAGRLHDIPAREMGFSYRETTVPRGWIFIEGTFRAAPGKPEAIKRRMAEIQEMREDTQPMRTRTGGSTFKNPPGKKAWRLIDAAGGRGLEIGGAKVSEKHCNFLINTGSATSGDLERLGEEVRQRVRKTHNIDLQWEIERIGKP